MFKLEGTTLHITRGDRGDIGISFENYTFKSGDTIEINIYNENSMHTEPILTKLVNVTAGVTQAELSLLGADTLLGDPITERTTYWYEIVFNGDQTVLGYDNLGPKILYLYPGGVN